MTAATVITSFPKSASIKQKIQYELKLAEQKIQQTIHSSFGKLCIGAGIGLYMPKISQVILNKVIPIILPNAVATPLPINSATGYITAPLVTVAIPVLEEMLFRGDLQTLLRDKLYKLYSKATLSEKFTKIAAQATAIFFTSVIFSLSHFSNALFFWCNPIYFLPQVIAAFVMGLVLGIAKEVSGSLHAPIGMHMANNIIAWAPFVTT